MRTLGRLNELKRVASSLVCLHIAVAKVLGWLDDVSDPLLQHFRLREATISLPIPDLRSSNSHLEHSTTRALGRHESNTAEQPVLLFLGAAECTQEPALWKRERVSSS